MSAIYLLELVAATDAAGTLTTLRYATKGYTTGRADTPADTHFDDRLVQPGSFRRELIMGEQAGEPARVGFGDIVLTNNDGGLDALLAYGFDGRSLTLRIGADTAAYPGGFTTVLVGTMDVPEFTRTEVKLRVRDRLADLDLPVCQNRYGGTNALPNGLDGVGDDFKGKPKPKLYGTANNFAPPCVNTSRLIYQVSDGTLNSGTVSNAYDRGLALTKGADYVSQADMEGVAPAANNFRVWPAGGYFRLGSAPTGLITCDASEGVNAAARTLAQVAKRIATDRGISAGDINAADVTALDLAVSGESGIYVDDEKTALTATAELMGCAAWFNFDQTGKLRMGQLAAPSGTPAAEFHDDQGDILELEILATGDADGGLPVWRVTVAGEKNYAVQATDLAGAVTQARRGWLANEFRTSAAEDATVKTQFLHAAEFRGECRLVQSALAAEATRLLALHKVRRPPFRVRVHADATTIAAVDLGSVVKIYHTRWSLTAGKLFAVIGLEPDHGKNELTLWIWG